MFLKKGSLIHFVFLLTFIFLQFHPLKGMQNHTILHYATDQEKQSEKSKYFPFTIDVRVAEVPRSSMVSPEFVRNSATGCNFLTHLNTVKALCNNFPQFTTLSQEQ